MSVVAAPIQQGTAPTNTQTRIHNNTLKVASIGGGQNAVYHVVGGPIASNVNLSLPAVSADDTIATLGANNAWTGQHSFAGAISASGPISSTAPISTSSSITGTSLFSQGGITSSGTIIAGGDITGGGNLAIAGNFNPANLSTPGTLGVGGPATLTGNSTFLHPSNAFSGGSGHVQFLNSNGGSSPAILFGIQAGDAGHGLIIGTSTTQGVSFFRTGTTGQIAATQQPAHGQVFAGVSYSSTTQNMVDDCYEALRNYGLLA